jgi:L-lactate dehydrogenase
VATVSTLNDNVEGIRDVTLSMPRVIARGGIVTNIKPRLDDGERSALRRSAEMLKQASDAITF